MVTLPKDFVKIWIPGYFWNTAEKKLYSIKVYGELKPLTYNKGGFFFGHDICPGYRVSHKGRKHVLSLERLRALRPTNNIEEIGIYRG